METELSCGDRRGTHTGYKRHLRGDRAACVECLAANNAAHRKYKQTEHGKAVAKAYNVANAGRARDRVLRKKYGISAEQFDGMLQQQGSRCAICQTDRPNGKYNVFHVDHCHDTAQVRGLLCYECNIGLGKFGDSVDRLARAIDYLNKAREAQ